MEVCPRAWYGTCNYVTCAKREVLSSYFKVMSAARSKQYSTATIKIASFILAFIHHITYYIVKSHFKHLKNTINQIINEIKLKTVIIISAGQTQHSSHSETSNQDTAVQFQQILSAVLLCKSWK